MSAELESAVVTARPTAAGSRAWRRFGRHFGEMLLAMLLGMAILGGAVAGVLAVAGTSVNDAAAWVRAGVMAATMTLPMVWWMQRRGHAPARSAEMAAAMIVPTLAAIALFEIGVLGSADALLTVQHVVMLPAMLGVMLWRFDHYAHSARELR